MIEKELETLGFYEPGFIHMRLNTDADISDLNELGIKDTTARYFSTFIHEYIHFLQEVTTTSGLLSSHFYINLLKEICFEIRNDGKEEFDVPYRMVNTNNIKANSELRKIYSGESRNITKVKYESYSEEGIIVTDKNGDSVLPKKYLLKVTDLGNGKTVDYHFGHLCLKEYVAHAVQTKHNPKVIHADLPYTIVEQIIAKEYPDFGDVPEHLIALCDSALMSMHPAQIFFITIERMKKEKFVPKSSDEVYQFVYSELKFLGREDIDDIGVDDLFKLIHNHTIGHYKDSLKSDLFKSNYDWLRHVLKHALILRLETPDFMSKLVKEDGTLSELFYDIVRRLGTPFITNKNMEGAFIPPEEIKTIPHQPYQLLVFKEVLTTFFGKYECELFDFCEKRKDKNITNSYCSSEPWKQVTQKELCPYGQLWKTWGLENEEPAKK